MRLGSRIVQQHCVCTVVLTMETPLVTPRSRSPVRPSLPRSRTSCPYAPSLRSRSADATPCLSPLVPRSVRHRSRVGFASRLSASEHQESIASVGGHSRHYVRPTFRAVLRRPWLRQSECGHPCPVALGGDSAGVGSSITSFKRCHLWSAGEPLRMSPSLTGTAPGFRWG